MMQSALHREQPAFQLIAPQVGINYSTDAAHLSFGSGIVQGLEAQSPAYAN
jgi:hypothetical protein